MNTLTASPFFLSLMSTVASMPFFLFTLPAGALADMVDRKNLLCLINLWLAIGAGGLSVLGWLHLLNPCVILAYIFLLGVGFAFNAPAWSSIVPQVVSNAELPSAVTFWGVAAQYLRNYRPGFRRSVGPADRSKLCVRCERRLFPRYDRGSPGVEKSDGASKPPSGELFGIFRHGFTLRPIFIGAPDRIGTKCSVCSVHQGNSRTDAGHRHETVIP